jgi:hypothetical protein
MICWWENGRLFVNAENHTAGSIIAKPVEFMIGFLIEKLKNNFSSGGANLSNNACFQTN